MIDYSLYSLENKDYLTVIADKIRNLKKEENTIYTIAELATEIDNLNVNKIPSSSLNFSESKVQITLDNAILESQNDLTLLSKAIYNKTDYTIPQKFTLSQMGAIVSLFEPQSTEADYNFCVEIYPLDPNYICTDIDFIEVKDTFEMGKFNLANIPQDINSSVVYEETKQTQYWSFKNIKITKKTWVDYNSLISFYYVIQGVTYTQGCTAVLGTINIQAHFKYNDYLRSVNKYWDYNSLPEDGNPNNQDIPEGDFKKYEDLKLKISSYSDYYIPTDISFYHLEEEKNKNFFNLNELAYWNHFNKIIISPDCYLTNLKVYEDTQLYGDTNYTVSDYYLQYSLFIKEQETDKYNFYIDEQDIYNNAAQFGIEPYIKLSFLGTSDDTLILEESDLTKSVFSIITELPIAIAKFDYVLKSQGSNLCISQGDNEKYFPCRYDIDTSLESFSVSFVNNGSLWTDVIDGITYYYCPMSIYATFYSGDNRSYVFNMITKNTNTNITETTPITITLKTGEEGEKEIDFIVGNSTEEGGGGNEEEPEIPEVSYYTETFDTFAISANSKYSYEGWRSPVISFIDSGLGNLGEYEWTSDYLFNKEVYIYNNTESGEYIKLILNTDSRSSDVIIPDETYGAYTDDYYILNASIEVKIRSDNYFTCNIMNDNTLVATFKCETYEGVFESSFDQEQYYSLPTSINVVNEVSTSYTWTYSTDQRKETGSAYIFITDNSTDGGNPLTLIEIENISLGENITSGSGVYIDSEYYYKVTSSIRWTGVADENNHNIFENTLEIKLRFLDNDYYFDRSDLRTIIYFNDGDSSGTLYFS